MNSDRIKVLNNGEYARLRVFSITVYRHRVLDALEKKDPKQARIAMTEGVRTTKAMLFALIDEDELQAKTKSKQKSSRTRHKR